MELTKFCPRCGEETDKLYGEEKQLCSNCFPDENDLLDIPDVVEIEVCSVCGRMRKKGEWIENYSVEDQLASRFEEFSKEDIEMELQYWEEEKKMFVRVHAARDEIRDFYDTEIRFEKDQCDTCSRFESGFFKVKMQLRGEKELEKISENIVDKAAEVTNSDRKDFMSNLERKDKGYNFFFSTEKIAGEILNMLKAKHDPDVKRSYELIGEEDGQEIYRNVISVRMD